VVSLLIVVGSRPVCLENKNGFLDIVIERMRSQIDQKLANSDSYRHLKEVNSQIPERSFHHHTHVLWDLRDLLGREPKNYLEIGSYCGSSAGLMLSHPFPTHVYCVDPLELPKSHYNGQLDQESTLKKNLDRFEKNYTIFKNYSGDKQLLDYLKQSDAKIDLLFIDGGHSFQQVIADFDNYHQFVNGGGFIVFDDYLDKQSSPQVRPAVDSIVRTIQKSHLPYEIVGSLPNYQKAFSRYPKKNLNEFILYKMSDKEPSGITD
jgi:predicted O-methyltransferase YrrM